MKDTIKMLVSKIKKEDKTIFSFIDKSSGARLFKFVQGDITFVQDLEKVLSILNTMYINGTIIGERDSKKGVVVMIDNANQSSENRVLYINKDKFEIVIDKKDELLKLIETLSYKKLI